MTERQQKLLIRALENNWQTEMAGYYTYQSLAEAETDSQRRTALEGLSLAEKSHADLWAQRIQALGGDHPRYLGSLGGEASTLQSRVGGPELTLRRLEIDESRDIAKYAKQLRELGDEPSLAILRTVVEDEKEHYRTSAILCAVSVHFSARLQSRLKHR